MKKLYIILVLCAALTHSSFGQGVITANNLNVIGDITTIAICGGNVVNPGPAGADQIWDMSNLSETEEQSFNFVDPEETLWGYEFPTSTLCGISWLGEHSYYRFDDDGVSVVGYAGLSTIIDPTDTFKIIFSEAENFIPIPFEYNDMHQDDFAGTSYAFGFEVPFTGDVDFEADGYGTLILPTGTYENVVRYHFFRTQINGSGLGSTTQTKEQWGWMSEDHRFWLMIQEINNDGFSDAELIWYDKDPLPALPTDVKDLEELTFEMYPNPANIGQSVNLSWERSETAQVSLTNVSGQQIFNKQINLQQGFNTINLSSVPAIEGLYFVQILTDHGSAMSKLVLKK